MISSQMRKRFLRGLRLSPSMAAWPAWMPRLAFRSPETSSPGDTLVVIFLRGAADALNMVVPHGEEAYYGLRPTLAVPRPDDSRFPESERTIDLDGFFGLHPALSPLLPAWEGGQLAVIHACGAPDDSRSHFRAMELMERGVSDEQGPASGWIGRHLASSQHPNASPLRALGLGEMTPRSLYGSVPVTALKSIIDFHLGKHPAAAVQMQSILARLYDQPDSLGTLGRETLDILQTVEALHPEAYRPAGGAAYPLTDFGQGLKQIAVLVKARVGLEVAAIDLGGWDTHFAQGVSEGLMPSLMENLGQGLAAIHRDLAEWMGQVTIVVMSEFGRRVKENASLGTDHGHGSLMILMGGHVAGRKVHSLWPGLSQDRLFGPGDLAVTVDYRDILGEICALRLNNPSLDEIFPGFAVTPRGFVEPS